MNSSLFLCLVYTASNFSFMLIRPELEDTPAKLAATFIQIVVGVSGGWYFSEWFNSK